MWNSKTLFVENKALKLLEKYLLTYSYGQISIHKQIEITLWFILPLNAHLKIMLIMSLT